MKILIFFLLGVGTLIASAQKVIILEVNQPPEFGFSVSNQDTTILKGNSVVLGTDLSVFGGSGNFYYRWSPVSTLNDSTAINPVATPIDTTVYLLTVTDSLGCSFSLNYKVNTRDPGVYSEISSDQGKLQAILFPNPNDGKFKVKITGIPAERIELTICNILGEIIKKQTIHNFSGDCTETIHVQLASGVYTLMVDSGKETLNRQFIIN